MADTTSDFSDQGIEGTVNQLQRHISVDNATIAPHGATEGPINGAKRMNGERLDDVIHEALEGLRDMQLEDGEWMFPLEADATIPAEYILLQHYLDEIDPVIQEKLATYLRACQGDHGGWPLHYRSEERGVGKEGRSRWSPLQ